VPSRAFALTHSSSVPNWRTEDALYLALDQEFKFAWDAAATAASCRVKPHSRCSEPYYGPDHREIQLRDALRVSPWSNYGSIFCNPPSSREEGHSLLPWIKKFREQADRGATIVSVIPHKTSSRYWQHVRHAVEIREIPHRVRYWLSVDELAAINDARGRAGRSPIKSGDSAGFDTAVVIWRPQPGIIQPACPRVVTWTYRGAKA